MSTANKVDDAVKIVTEKARDEQQWREEATLTQVRDAIATIENAIKQDTLDANQMNVVYNELSGVLFKGRELFRVALSDQEKGLSGEKRFTNLVHALHDRDASILDQHL